MDPLFVLFMLFLFFLAGVGVGTFVLGSRIRSVVAEAILYARKEEQVLVGAVQTGKYAIEKTAADIVKDLRLKK